MKKYNHCLDFTVLALASAADGDYTKAAKLLVKASQAHDVQRAVAVLEASNAQAFQAEQARVQAAAKVVAKTKVKAFDIGDDSAIDDLIGDDVATDVADDVGGEADVPEAGGDEFDVAFATVLRAMTAK